MAYALGLEADEQEQEADEQELMVDLLLLVLAKSVVLLVGFVFRFFHPKACVGHAHKISPQFRVNQWECFDVAPFRTYISQI